MQTDHSSPSHFARDVDPCVRKYPNESEVLRRIKPLLEKLIRSPRSVPTEAFIPERGQVRDEPDPYANRRDVLDNRRSLASGPNNPNPRPSDMGACRGP